MKGDVARKGDRLYAVICEGRDPITGREQRRWHPAGDDEEAARALAGELVLAHAHNRPSRSSLTVAIYLTQRWLPSKRVTLRVSTYDAYRRVVDLHVLPHIGRVPLRHLRPDHLERLYATLAANGRADGTGGLSNKTVVEVHTMPRQALEDARRRGLIMANPASITHAPKRRPLESTASGSWPRATPDSGLSRLPTGRSDRPRPEIGPSSPIHRFRRPRRSRWRAAYCLPSSN